LKSINPLSAIVLIRLPLDDVRPIHGFNQQAIEAELKSRYNLSDSIQNSQVNLMGSANPGTFPLGFTGLPIGAGLPLQKPISLMNGQINVGDDLIGITGVSILPDFSMIKLDVLSTDDGDRIADDIIVMLEGSFRFRNLRSNTFRYYGSSIVLQFDRPLEDLILKLKKIEDVISPIIKSSHGIKEDIKIERLSFRCDPLEIPSSKLIFMDAFTIERRAGLEYSENRYFSGAPMKTTQHIDALLAIERIVSSMD
jgi:hypothetical protein